MNSTRVHIILYMSALLLFASCGQQYDAEQTIKAFIEENMEAASEITDRDFANLGSTQLIGDSLLQVMQHRGAKLFRKGIKYPKLPDGELYYLRMSYVHKGDTLQNTFYLNQELTEVVAFK